MAAPAEEDPKLTYAELYVREESEMLDDGTVETLLEAGDELDVVCRKIEDVVSDVLEVCSSSVQVVEELDAGIVEEDWTGTVEDCSSVHVLDDACARCSPEAPPTLA